MKWLNSGPWGFFSRKRKAGEEVKKIGNLEATAEEVKKEFRRILRESLTQKKKEE